MRPSSSTSASERIGRAQNVIVFAATLLVLLVPYEWAVRRSEHVYGERRAFFSTTSSPLTKVDALHALASRTRELDVLVVGTSVAEYGIDPRLLQSRLDGTRNRQVFNASIGGVSSIVGLDLAAQFGLRPRLLIVSVSPMDFTDAAQLRGARFLRHAQSLTSTGKPVARDIRERIETAVGGAFRAVCHASSPERRRTLVHWLDFFEADTNPGLLAFLNSEAVAGPQCATCWDGYIGATSANTAAAVFFREGNAKGAGAFEAGTSPQAFLAEHRTHVESLRTRLQRLVRAGTRVVLVRVPTSPRFRAIEDETTKFDDAMIALASTTQVPYVDARLEPSFAAEPRNFVDTHHLSYRGSREFTLALARELRGISPQLRAQSR